MADEKPALDVRSAQTDDREREGRAQQVRHELQQKDRLRQRRERLERPLLAHEPAQLPSGEAGEPAAC